MRDGQVFEGKDGGLEEEESELARKEQLEKRSHCGGEKTSDERQEMMREIVLSV